MEQLQHIRHLCSQVHTIAKKHEDIARMTGANFNIFEILRMESDEKRLHSRIIGELLNPNGSHGLGDKFLLLFLNQVLDKKEFENVAEQYEGAVVETEKYIGNIDSENQTGGFIDIFIRAKLGSKNVIIENKIFAGDQFGQLRRYHNYDKDAIVIYLTLFGEEPSNKSTMNNNDSQFKDDLIEPIQFSYKRDIIHWLNNCLKEATNLPYIRETINQYINTLKSLTGQNMNNKIDEEVTNMVMKSKENLEAAFILAGNIDKTINHIINETFLPQLKAAFGSDSSSVVFDWNGDKINWNGDKYMGFDFTNPDWKYCKICFEFQGNKGRFDELIYGLTYVDKTGNEKIKERILKDLEDLGVKKVSNSWLQYKYFDAYRDWYNPDAMWAILSGKMVTLFKEAIDELLDFGKGKEW